MHSDYLEICLYNSLRPLCKIVLLKQSKLDNMKNLLKLTMIVSFALTLIACGRMGDLVPVTDTQADSETATSSTY